MANHSVSNPGPEKTQFDNRRHQEMNLKRNGLYGISKFFVNGSAPSRYCESCGKVKFWCECDAKSK